MGIWLAAMADIYGASVEAIYLDDVAGTPTVYLHLWTTDGELRKYRLTQVVIDGIAHQNLEWIDK